MGERREAFRNFSPSQGFVVLELYPHMGTNPGTRDADASSVQPPEPVLDINDLVLQLEKRIASSRTVDLILTNFFFLPPSTPCKPLFFVPFIEHISREREGRSRRTRKVCSNEVIPP